MSQGDSASSLNSSQPLEQKGSKGSLGPGIGPEARITGQKGCAGPNGEAACSCSSWNEAFRDNELRPPSAPGMLAFVAEPASPNSTPSPSLGEGEAKAAGQQGNRQTLHAGSQSLYLQHQPPPTPHQRTCPSLAAAMPADPAPSAAMPGPALHGLGSAQQLPQHSRQCGICDKAEEGKDGGPVFVPVVLRMDAKSHGLLLEDWCMRQPVRLRHLSPVLILKSSCLTSLLHCFLQLNPHYCRVHGCLAIQGKDDLC